jgi:hypothetical protein
MVSIEANPTSALWVIGPSVASKPKNAKLFYIFRKNSKIKQE